jgi:ABC-2 type transport system permease protein
MKKLWLIGIKDVTLAFRDRAALVLMLLAPFLLTLGLGFVTGQFGSGGGPGGLSEIPVALVNQDEGELGRALVEVFQSDELSGLVIAQIETDPAAARQQVDDDELAAVVVIPAGFTASIIPSAGGQTGEAVKIAVYANPTRPVSNGVVQAVLEYFLNQVEAGRVGGQVAVLQLLENGLISPAEAAAAAGDIGVRLAAGDGEAVIGVNAGDSGEAAPEFNILAYIAPGMALMFLMFTVTYGGRSLLAERAQGTLPRLLVSPTSSAQVLGGKVLGVYLTGVIQVGILIGASATLFQLNWGSPLGVIALVLAAAFGATGWGMLLTALARTPNQVASAGSALMLTFGILGGSFISLNNLPPVIQWASKITPNAWGLEGFTTLAQGGSAADLGTPLAALLIMGAVLFIAAVLIFNRQRTLAR